MRCVSNYCLFRQNVLKRKGGEIKVFNMTVVQAQNQLTSLRSRRTRILEDIDVLRECRTQITIIKKRFETKTTTFHQASERQKTDWRGKSGIDYNSHRSQTRTNTNHFMVQIDRTSEEISTQINRFNTQITNINSNIRDLENFIRNEGMV